MTELLSLWPTRAPLYGPGPKMRSRRAMDHIAYDVARRHGLTVEDLKRRDQRRDISGIRMAAMHAIYATGRFSYPVVGAYFDGRDHTTVIHADRRTVELCAEARP